METDKKKVIAIVLGAIALILIALGFVSSYKKNKEAKETFDPSIESTRGTEDTAEVLDVKHQYKNGVHTFAGEMSLPTPCDAVEVKAEKGTTNAKKVNLAFTTSNTAEVCTQVLSPRRFKVTFVADKDAVVTGTLNGAPIRLNVFEVPPIEDLDAYEINIKG